MQGTPSQWCLRGAESYEAGSWRMRGSAGLDVSTLVGEGRSSEIGSPSKSPPAIATPAGGVFGAFSMRGETSATLATGSATSQ